MYKAVFHIDECSKDKGDLILKNIEGLIGEIQAEAELVANYEAVPLYLKKPDLYGAKIKELSGRGVRFVACARAMAMFNVTKDMLLEPFETVPAAMAELVKKQSEGWAYIKP
jgi:intracellular sulfur oxidation DsrE/DsrF family protein